MSVRPFRGRNADHKSARNLASLLCAGNGSSQCTRRGGKINAASGLNLPRQNEREQPRAKSLTLRLCVTGGPPLSPNRNSGYGA